jgi:hypothetical protein
MKPNLQIPATRAESIPAVTPVVTLVTLLAAALLLLLAAGARADVVPGSSLTLQPLALNALIRVGEAPITLRTVSYRPRSMHVEHPREERPPGFGSQTQIHGGIFNPSVGSGQGFTMGLRGGPNLAPHLQLGIAMDWEHRGSQSGSVVGSSVGPGGTVVVTRQVISSSENTFPLMAYLQISGSEKRVLVPYAGIAGGYEIVTLDAVDYLTSTSFNATYGGWGWQSWAGLRVPFSPHSGLLAEVYTNQATAYRDVYDPFYGMTLRESVGLDGVGFRGGLSWGIF